MIDLVFEKDDIFSAQDKYDIINFALAAAEESGFLNRFVFERALWLFAMYALDKDNAELRNELLTNILMAWDKYCKNGDLEKFQQEYAASLDNLGAEADLIYEEYQQYAISIKGSIDGLQLVGDDTIQAALTKFQSLKDDQDVQRIMKISESWGMERPDFIEDSLFSAEEGQKKII